MLGARRRGGVEVRKGPDPSVFYLEPLSVQQNESSTIYTPREPVGTVNVEEMRPP